MQLLSAHTAFGLVAAMLVVTGLVVLGVPALAALLVGIVVGPVLTQTFLGGVADRAEHWLTTPKPGNRRR